MASALLDDAVYRCQPKPRSLACFFGGEEWFENVGSSRFVHPNPVIGDSQHDVLSRRHRRMFTGKGFVKVESCSLQNQPASMRHCIPRIDCEVQDNLIEMNGINFYHSV